MHRNASIDEKMPSLSLVLVGRSQFKGKVNGYPSSSRRVNRLFKSDEKPAKTCIFNRMPGKLKKIPKPLKHIKKYRLLEGDGNPNSTFFYPSSNSTFCLLQQPICMRKTSVLGESGFRIINNVSYGRLVGHSCKCCPLQGVVNCKCSPLHGIGRS